MPDLSVAPADEKPAPVVEPAPPGPARQSSPAAARRLAAVVLQRIGVLLFQVWSVVTITFILVHLMPGNPAQMIAGPFAPPEGVVAVEQRLGLDRPLLVQYWKYISGVARGDLGDSLNTGNPVLEDLAQRVPATLGLITLALICSGALTIGLTWIMLALRRRFAGRIVKFYTVVGAGLPDFWVGIGLAFVFYFVLGVAPAPSGQLDSDLEVPTVTNFALLDALITGHWYAIPNALAHLALPVATLAIISAASMTRLTAASALTAMDQDHIRFAKALGVGRRRTEWYAIRSALPTFVSTSSLVYAGLLGGAVLVETVYGWAGLGQYGVDAIRKSDYAALQGFVIVAGVFTAIVYLLVDIAYRLVNPRTRR